MGEVEKEAVCVPLSTDGSRGDDDFSKIELKRDHQCLVDDAEPDTFPNKRQAKEVSNDDVRSEVSNPIISPKENASNFHDITSQPAEFANSNRVECDEATSTCSGNSSSEETLSDGEPSGNDNSRIDIETCGAVLTSRVVLEIPEHASTTGIRKITFKLSKRKEDHDNHSSVSEAQPMANGFGGSYSYSGSCEESARDFSFPLDSTSELPACSYSKGSSGNRDFYVSSHGLESKPSKKVVPSSYPTNVKKLLATGILDGAQVKYVYGTPEKVLSGIINGGGYLCGCESCNFSKVLSAYEFEQHAGLKTRHPNNHIYLENGRPIYSIIQELKTAPLSVLDEVIKDVAGSSLNEEFFQLWKASLRQSNKNAEVDKSCYVPAFRENDSPTAYTLLQSESFKKKMYMETVESRKHLTKRPNSYVSNSLVSKKTGEGGTKRRDNDLHKLLFMPNGLPDGAELAYYVKGQRILGGYKQGNGIVCSCCYREVSPSQFEAHAGMAARRQPYRHIYTSNGLTLHDIAISLANGQNITTGDSDDMCAVCGNGGDLILCRVCPRAFHAACLDLQRLPECDWHCPNCTGRKTNAGESSGSGRPIVIRLTRVVKQPEFDIGGCAVCRGHDFSAAKFDERTVMICDQCEKEFHVGCLRESRLCDLKELPTNKWFCCDDCSRIHMALHNLVSFGAEMVPASVSYTIIRKHADQGLFMGAADDDVQWRILSGKSRYPEHLPFLSRSAAIFRECFDPIVAKSGRDLIPVMVYGRNISGQEFGGMYCVVLIVRSIVVSAGLLRIFGREVAELPLVATSREHQGKGYFQALFSCIERLLCSLNVENLVLPAAEDAESIWTRKLGFKKMTEERLSEYLKTVQLTMFNGTSMLEKAVPQTTE